MKNSGKEGVMVQNDAKIILLPIKVIFSAASIPKDPILRRRAAVPGAINMSGIASKPNGKDQRQRKGSTIRFIMGPISEKRLK